MSRALTGAALVGGLLVGSALSTQYLAKTFNYSPQLGAPLAQGRTPLYPPLAWVGWRRRWGSQAPRPFRTASSLLLAGAAMGLAGALAGLRGAKHKPKGLFGSARWGTDKDLREARLLVDHGIVLAQTAEASFQRSLEGQWQQRRLGRLIRHGGSEHLLVYAPTRSGKGVGPVISTLLSCTSSVVVYDPKRENWEMTSRWRSQFSRVLLFDPSSLRSLRFNPMLEVRPYPYDVRDAQNLAECVVSTDSTQEQQSHWSRTGRAFLAAVLLHVLYAEKDKSLAGVLRFLSERGLEDALEEMMTTPHFAWAPQAAASGGAPKALAELPHGVHPAIYGGAQLMASRADNERSGVLSTAMSFLELYRDPIVAYNTSHSDFTASDLMCGPHPVTLHLVVPPSDTERAQPLVRTLLNFFGRRFTEDLELVHTPAGSKPRRHSLLYLMDEFPELGNMPHFERALAYQAGYRLKYLLIAQSLNQIEKAYGANNAILDNCHVRLTYGANDERTAQRVSTSMGTQSIVVESHGENRRDGLCAQGGRSTSYSERGVPLKTPGDILSLPATEAIVMASGSPPYLAKKVMYYQDPRFAGRYYDQSTGANVPLRTLEEIQAQAPPQEARSPWLAMGALPRPACGGPDDEVVADAAEVFADGELSDH